MSDIAKGKNVRLRAGKRFHEMLMKYFPTDYIDKRIRLLNESFSQSELERLDGLLKVIRGQLFQEAEDDHIKG